MSKKVAIIFGINGQDGYYLSKLLKNQGIDVIGISRTNINYLKGDVSDFNFVKKVILLYSPDYIFHFAAISSIKHDYLFENHSAISIGTLNILECVKLYSSNTKVFISGSAMQFLNNGTPINENTPFDSNSAYSCSRIDSVYTSRYFRNKFNLKVYIGYLFNHDSPLRTINHINQQIIVTAKKIKYNEDNKITIGNPSILKEYNFAGDIVNAIWCLVQQDRIFETVIGSGIVYSIYDWAKYVFSSLDLVLENYLTIDKNFKTDYQILQSDPKLIKSLGWNPTVDFFELANLMISKQ
jgi:GDPmannose 4,6-dehydratase